MFIRTERLFLRPGWPEDWRDLFTRIAEPEIVRNLARAPWPYQPADARAFASSPQDQRFPHFLVTLPGGDGASLIGAVGLGRDEQGRTELGYWIARPYWGKGYAPEAARATLHLARTLGHGRAVASHFADNPASGRVLAKVGFRPTGAVRPRFSLARGADAESVEYAIELGAASDCDGAQADAVPAMRAA